MKWNSQPHKRKEVLVYAAVWMKVKDTLLVPEGQMFQLEVVSKARCFREQKSGCQAVGTMIQFGFVKKKIQDANLIEQ